MNSMYGLRGLHVQDNDNDEKLIESYPIDDS